MLTPEKVATLQTEYRQVFDKSVEWLQTKYGHLVIAEDSGLLSHGLRWLVSAVDTPMNNDVSAAVDHVVFGLKDAILLVQRNDLPTFFNTLIWLVRSAEMLDDLANPLVVSSEE